MSDFFSGIEATKNTYTDFIIQRQQHKATPNTPNFVIISSKNIEASQANIKGDKEQPIMHMQKNTEFYTPLSFALKDIKNDPKITKKKIELNIFSVS